MYRLSLLAALIFSLFWRIWNAYSSNYLQVVICNVGQGDGIVLIYQSFQIVIDAGVSPDKMLECLSQHVPFWDRTIEYVVATHADADHIGGLTTILQRYHIGTAVANYSDKDTQLAQELYSQLQIRSQANLLDWQYSHFLETISINQTLSLQIISPPEVVERASPGKHDKTETMLSAKRGLTSATKTTDQMSENDRSIAIYVQFGQFSTMLTGDLECPGEIAMLAGGVTKRSNVLKVGHHGAKTSTCPSFVDTIQPEHAVISAGKNNRYNHPTLEVLSNLVARGAQIWRTDQQGTVVITSDGTNYWVAVQSP